MMEGWRAAGWGVWHEMGLDSGRAVRRKDSGGMKPYGVTRDQTGGVWYDGGWESGGAARRNGRLHRPGNGGLGLGVICGLSAGR